MKKNNLIASRTLYLNSDESQKIEVKIWQPYKNVESPSVSCPFSISLPGGKLIELEGHGEDSVQALIMTLEMVGIKLRFYNENYLNHDLTWLGKPEICENFGFLYPKDVKGKE